MQVFIVCWYVSLKRLGTTVKENNCLEQATGDTKFAVVVRDIIDYTIRDLRHPLGGFFSGEDADSLPTPDAEKKQGEIQMSIAPIFYEQIFCTKLYLQIFSTYSLAL